MGTDPYVKGLEWAFMANRGGTAGNPVLIFGRVFLF